MKRLQRLATDALAALAILAAAPASANGLPEPLAPFDAMYRVTDGSSRLGEAEFGLEEKGGTWRYYSRVKPEGLYALLIGKVEDTAWLESHAGGLRPLRFIHDEDGDEDDIRIEFDWPAGEALVERRGTKRRLSLDPGTHDQFSAMLAVIHNFAAGRERLELPSIDDEGEREPLVFVRAGEISIDTPMGRFDTVHVRRVRRNSKRETESWLAPSLGWIPVRIDQSRKGELVARMELSGLNGERAAPVVESER